MSPVAWRPMALALSLVLAGCAPAVSPGAEPATARSSAGATPRVTPRPTPEPAAPSPTGAGWTYVEVRVDGLDGRYDGLQAVASGNGAYIALPREDASWTAASDVALASAMEAQFRALIDRHHLVPSPTGIGEAGEGPAADLRSPVRATCAHARHSSTRNG